MSKAMWQGVITAVLAVCFFVSGVNGEIRKFGEVKDADWELGAPAKYPEANAIIIFDRAEIRVTDDGIERYYHRRVKVLTQAGIEAAGEQSFYYDREFDRLRKLQAHTITPDGKKHKVEKGAIFEKQIDWRTERTLAFPAITVGSILEIELLVVSKRFRYLAPWYFQNHAYTMLSTCSVDLPDFFSYDARCFNIPYGYQKPEVTERIDVKNIREAGTKAMITTYTWTLTDQMPAVDEPYMMAIDNFRPNLQFKLVEWRRGPYAKSFLQTWPEIGDVFQDDYKDYFDADDRVRALAIQLTAGRATAEEKSRALYDHVINGYQTGDNYTGKYVRNEKRSQLLDGRTGSAEEKNMLLTTLHQAAGLTANSVMIGTRDRRRLDPDPGAADIRQFNYLITVVKLPDHYEFLDASSRYVPYGLLPPNCLASGGLMIDADSSKLIQIAPNVKESSRHDVTHLRVSSDGEVAAVTTSELTGYYAAQMACEFEGTTPEKYMEDSYLKPLGVQYTLDSVTAGIDSGHAVKARLVYTSTDMTQMLDENVLLKLVGFDFRDNPFPRERRTYPIDFNYPFKYENTIEIESERPVKSFQLPSDTTINLGDAFLKRTSRLTETGATVDWMLSVRTPEFDISSYPGLRDLFAQLALWDDEEAALVPDQTKPEPGE